MEIKVESIKELGGTGNLKAFVTAACFLSLKWGLVRLAGTHWVPWRWIGHLFHRIPRLKEL